MSNSDFLRLAANARRKQRGEPELEPLEFYGFVMPKVRQHSVYICVHAWPESPGEHFCCHCKESVLCLPILCCPASLAVNF